MRAATCADVTPRSVDRTTSPWLIGMPPNDLCEIFAEADADQEIFGFAELAVACHALGVGGKLADGLDIGCEPGEPVGGPLLAIETRPSTCPFDETRSRTFAVASASKASRTAVASRISPISSGSLAERVAAVDMQIIER